MFRVPALLMKPSEPEAQVRVCARPSLALRAQMIVLALTLASTVLAQDLSIDPPVADRPEDFSNIVGKYTIKATAKPTEVHVEEPITVHIYITGEGPAKYEPQRRHLRLLPAFDDDFYVQPIPDEDKVMREQKTWLFVYRLRPKHAKIEAIEGIKLVYFDPSRGGLPKKKFVSAFVDGIPIKVTPKPETAPNVSVDGLAFPDSFYRVESAGVLNCAAAPFSLSGLAAMLFLGGVPVTCLVGALVWRRCVPDSQQVHARQRDAAALRALGRLENGEPAGQVVCQYLRERLDFPLDEPTPMEIAAFLDRRGCTKELCRQVHSFFQAGDAMRFGSGATSKRQDEEVQRLIQALEGDPCARI